MATTTSKATTVTSTETPASPVTSTSSIKKETSPVVWVLVGIIISLLVGGLVVALLFMTGYICRVPGFQNLEACYVWDGDMDDGDDADGEDFIEVTSPKEGATVKGKIEFEGTWSVEDATGITVMAYDDEDTLVGLGVALVGGPKPEEFTGEIIINASPATATGYILFTSEDVEEKVEIKFDMLTTGSIGGQERLKVTAPMEYQYIPVVTGANFFVKGEMKDFFEAQLNYRLVDDEGVELYEGHVTASGDNYGKFAPFTFELSYEAIDVPEEGTAQTGKIVFYDVSAKDGSETTILELPVTLYTGE